MFTAPNKAPRPSAGKPRGARQLATRAPAAHVDRTVTVAERQQQMIADFLLIEDAQERLAAIVDRARPRLAASRAEHIDDHRVRGCVSAVWLVCEARDGRCWFRSDAESPLVRGVVALLCDLYDGGAPAEIVATEPALVEELGLARTLSPTRLNGLRSVRARIRDYAAAQLASSAPRGS